VKECKCSGTWFSRKLKKFANKDFSVKSTMSIEFTLPAFTTLLYHSIKHRDAPTMGVCLSKDEVKEGNETEQKHIVINKVIPLAHTISLALQINTAMGLVSTYFLLI
jgi:hypothetical protein